MDLKFSEVKEWTTNYVHAWVERNFFPRRLFRNEYRSGRRHDPIVTNDNGYLDTSFFQRSGSWTPVVADATSGGNLASLGSASATYVRIGDVVTVTCNINNITTTGMTAGNGVFIRGLPFTAATGSWTGVLRPRFVTFSGSLPPFVLTGNSISYVHLRNYIDANNDGPLLVSQLTSGSADLYFSLTYITEDA